MFKLYRLVSMVLFVEDAFVSPSVCLWLLENQVSIGVCNCLGLQLDLMFNMSVCANTMVVLLQ